MAEREGGREGGACPRASANELAWGLTPWKAKRVDAAAAAG